MGHSSKPLPTERQYIVYCDESRHVRESANPFMGIGGLWVPYRRKDELRRRLDVIANTQLLRGELKWSKVSTQTLVGYKAVLDAFAIDPEMRFRAIIVDHAAVDYRQFHRGDRELGFYSFYYHMLVKWLQPATSYIILLDHKVNSRPGRYSALEERLRREVVPSTHIRQVTVADSRDSRLAQLADVLTGAVTAAWCNNTPGESAKAMLQHHLAKQLGVGTLRRLSSLPTPDKFNIFKIDLARGQR
jgi:hypothetical protein